MTTIGKAVLAACAPVCALMLPAPALATVNADRLDAAKAAMMGDTAEALRLAREVRASASQDTVEANRTRLTARWLEGEALIRLNRQDEAETIVLDALDEAAESFAGEKIYADLLRSKASLKSLAGNYGEALSAFLEAHDRYQSLDDTRSQAIVLQNIGSLYSDAHDFERVMRYYREANETHSGDLALSLSAHNNIGNALKELGRLEQAEAEFERALAVAQEMESPALEARILTNIASVQYHRERYGEARSTIERAQRIAKREAPAWLPFVYGVRSQILAAIGATDLARRDVERTFAGQDLTETSPYFRDFHKAAHEVYSRSGEYRKAMAHLSAYHRLDGQARELSSSANSALLAARFDSENRELRISALSAQNAANEAQLVSSQNKIWVLSGVVLFILMALLGVLALLRMLSRSKKAVTQANAKLTYVIQHDGLTGLHSRDHFHTLLREQTASVATSGEEAVLMLIDLDRFKQVNDTYGHVAGDHLLVETAARFREAAGPDAVIGRLGGDEFALVLPHPCSLEESWDVARAIIERIAVPFPFEGQDMSVGASVGIARIDSDLSSISALVTNADLALYEAKRRGRGTYVNYAPAMRSTLEDRVSIENDLACALEKGEIAVSYQPIVRGDDNTVVCYEALMRWNHPERGAVPPSLFVSVAEDALLIDALGEWLLRTACRDAAQWDDRVKLSVNVSTLQLSKPAFLSTVIEALANSGLAPDRLVLELTETAVLEMSEDVERLIRSLTELGVSFALDDFGRGYSSLNYIEKMQFSMIKIDSDFVQAAAAGSNKSRAVVTAIVSLAGALGIDVTAEGIENDAQAASMRALGCSCFQGFRYGRPGDVDAPSVEDRALRA